MSLSRMVRSRDSRCATRRAAASSNTSGSVVVFTPPSLRSGRCARYVGRSQRPEALVQAWQRRSRWQAKARNLDHQGRSKRPDQHWRPRSSWRKTSSGSSGRPREIHPRKARDPPREAPWCRCRPDRRRPSDLHEAQGPKAGAARRHDSALPDPVDLLGHEAPVRSHGQHLPRVRRLPCEARRPARRRAIPATAPSLPSASCWRRSCRSSTARSPTSRCRTCRPRWALPRTPSPGC